MQTVTFYSDGCIIFTLMKNGGGPEVTSTRSSSRRSSSLLNIARRAPEKNRRRELEKNAMGFVGSKNEGATLLPQLALLLATSARPSVLV